MIPLLWESLFQQSYDKDITNLYQSYDRVMTMTQVITKLWQSHSIVLTKCVMRKFEQRYNKRYSKTDGNDISYNKVMTKLWQSYDKVITFYNKICYNKVLTKM